MLVAMPFKLLLFVLVDGWSMTVGSLVATYSIEDKLNSANLFDQNVEFLRIAFWQIIVAAGPLLAIGLAVGLTIGIIQAATSINE